jgi:GH24 family phage-related lysozyme (muramidase)
MFLPRLLGSEGGKSERRRRARGRAGFGALPARTRDTRRIAATLAQLTKALAEAKRRQHAARLAWRKAAEKHPKGDRRIRETLAAYKRAKAERRRLDRQIARLQPATSASAKGLAFLIAEEGFVPYAYNDPANHATFGVGHLLHRGPVTAADRAQWGTKAKPKPRALVEQVLRDDLARRYEPAVKDAVKRPLQPHQFDALLSLCFNIGTGGFKGSTVVKRLNAGDFAGAADAILLWNKPSILIPRRRRERELFLNGVYR